MHMDEAFNRLPEPIIVFLERKFAGMFVLCQRLRAQAEFRGLLAPKL